MMKVVKEKKNKLLVKKKLNQQLKQEMLTEKNTQMYSMPENITSIILQTLLSDDLQNILKILTIHVKSSQYVVTNMIKVELLMNKIIQLKLKLPQDIIYIWTISIISFVSQSIKAKKLFVDTIRKYLKENTQNINQPYFRTVHGKISLLIH